MKTSFISLSLLILSLTACGKSSDSNDNKSAPVAAPGTDNAQGTVVDSGAAPAASVTNGTTTEQPTASTGTTTETGTTEVVTETPVAVLGPVVATEVDATNKTDWAYLDLDTLKIVPATDASWDLAFKRTSVKLNADVKATTLSEGTVFDAITKAPAAAYTTDAPVVGGLETDGLFFHTPTPWYSYDINVHVISSRNLVYVVQTNGGQDVKLAFSDYYNLDRLPAFIQLKTQALGKTAVAE